MLPNSVHRLHLLSRQLTSHLMSAALCAREIEEIVQMDDRRPGPNGKRAKAPTRAPRPLLDEATLTVLWREHTLYLGYTIEFRLLAYLTRRVNQYVTHVDLLDEIWDDDFADSSVLRAAIQRLRAKLRQGGMTDLADAVTGCKGRYILDLASADRVTKMSH